VSLIRIHIEGSIDMHHIFVMKFSCFLNPWAGDIGRGGFSNMWYSFVKDEHSDVPLSREECESRYKTYLYSDARMKVKFAAFEKIFLPSLIGPNSERRDWTLFIFVTVDQMPAGHLERLKASVAHVPQIKIVNLLRVPYDDNEYIEYVEDRCKAYDKWSVIWLGDDDAINPRHLDLVAAEAATRDAPFIYTMPNLQYVSFDSSFNIVKGPIKRYPSVHGLALTGVGVNPMRLPIHYNIPKLCPDLPIVYNEDEIGGLLFCDETFTASRRNLEGRHSRAFKGDSY